MLNTYTIILLYQIQQLYSLGSCCSLVAYNLSDSTDTCVMSMECYGMLRNATVNKINY